MSLPRPSGLKAPGSKIGRPSGLPTAATAPKTGIPAPSAVPSKAQSPESDTGSLSTDDYKIGDRVWVSGTKPGIIAFIGETQFAPGDWAGVVLDDPIGKNDGSVMGIRYFQCEMKRGVFSRLTKLTRSQQLPGAESVNETNNSHAAHTNSSVPNKNATNGIPATMSNSATSPIPRPTTPRQGLGGSHAPSGSSSSLHKAHTSPSSNSAMNAAAARAGLKIGDRVLVSGSKAGILKYVGETDFAKGTWAGVELDEALGKNDGAVAGKRYFECKPLHGLFAPVHKVTRLGGNMSLSTPSPMSRSLGPGLRSARERSGSQESVSSISSSASSVSRSRVRLGVTSLANQTNKAGQRPSSLNLSATTTALQKALKEKEEHIEQLLRERDLERSEVARAAAQVDEAEGQLSSIRSEQERFRGDAEELISRLRGQVTELEKEKEELSSQLEDERRRVEDLQFQIEEEVICKDDLETTKEEDEMRLRELEKNYGKEKRRADTLEKELEALKIASEAQQSQLKEHSSSQSTYMDEIEDLTHKLSQAENRIKQFETSRLEEGAKSSQVSVELAEKAAKISELEELVSSQRKDLKMTQDTLQEVKEELASSNNRCKKLQESVDGLTDKLQALESKHTQANDELRAAKSQSSDLQVQLTASQQKSAELMDDRAKLEQQLAELMKNSGDSSNQLSALNLQLADKTRKLEELQSDLLSSSQQITKLSQALDEKERVQKSETEQLVHNFEDQLKTAQSQLEDMQLELEKAQTKLTKATEEGERERREEVGRREAEIEQLKQKLETQGEELTRQQVQTQAHKEYLDKVNLELETMKYEKEKAEKQVKRMEGERDTMNTELIQARVEVSKVQADSQEMTQQHSQLQEQIDDLTAEKERLMKSKQEVEKQRDDVKADKEKVAADRDHMQQEWVTLQAEMQKRDIQMEEMQKEMDRLRKQMEEKQEEIMQRSQTEADMLTEELEGWKQSLREKEAELTQLKADLELSKLKADDRTKLEKEREVMMKEIEHLKESHRQELAAAEAERVSLSNKVNITDQELHQQQQLLEQQIAKVTMLEAERQELKAATRTLENQRHSRESETQALTDKVNRLEKALAADMSGNSRESQLLQDKQATEQQVQFLNSVIVDLQHKNEEMAVRLQAMESATFSEDMDTELMAIPGNRSRPAPRLFCDICDVFDLHETDDCPKQAMSDSPPPSSHHGDRHSVRPYCDICEYFIDPDAADKHAHSKQLDMFFKQHVGFFSDDDADDLGKGRHQRHTPNISSPDSALSSPGAEGPADFENMDLTKESERYELGVEVLEQSVPCIVLSDTEDVPSPRLSPQNITDCGEGFSDPQPEQDTANVDDDCPALDTADSGDTFKEALENIGWEPEGFASEVHENDIQSSSHPLSHAKGPENDLQPDTDETNPEDVEKTDLTQAEVSSSHDRQPEHDAVQAEKMESIDQKLLDAASPSDDAGYDSEHKPSLQSTPSDEREDNSVPMDHPDQQTPNIPEQVSSDPEATSSETAQASKDIELKTADAEDTGKAAAPPTLQSAEVGDVKKEPSLAEAKVEAEKPADIKKEKAAAEKKAAFQTKGHKEGTARKEKGDNQAQNAKGDNHTQKEKGGNSGPVTKAQKEKGDEKRDKKDIGEIKGEQHGQGKGGDNNGSGSKGDQRGKGETTESKGEKPGKGEEKVTKRASAGASSLPPEDGGGAQGAERPDSCVVS